MDVVNSRLSSVLSGCTVLRVTGYILQGARCRFLGRRLLLGRGNVYLTVHVNATEHNNQRSNLVSGLQSVRSCIHLRTERLGMATGSDLMEDRKCLVVGISGATCSGKTTVVQQLCQGPQHSVVIHQDHYYLDVKEIPTMDDGTPMWDVPEALNSKKLVEHLEAVVGSPQNYCATCIQQPAVDTRHVVFIEGTMIHSIGGLKPLFDLAFFITLDFDACKDRRSTKKFVWATGKESILDPPGYFEAHVWPEYSKQLQALRADSTIRFVQGSQSIDELAKIISASIEERTV